MFRRSLKLIMAPLLAMMLILAGCGDDNGAAGGGNNTNGGSTIDDPNAAVLAAFSEIEASTVDISIKFDATADELRTAFEAEMTGEPAEQAVLEMLTKGEFHLASTDGAGAVALSIDGTNLFEFRVIDEVAYVRVDTNTALDLVRAIDPASAAEMSATLTELPMMLGADPSMSFLGDLIEGNWVSIPLPPESAFGELAAPAQDPEQLDAEVAEALAQIVDENTVVTPAGEARGGDKFLVEVRIADLVEAIAANPVASQVLDPGADADEMLAEMRAEGVPEVMEIDVVLIDGQLSSVRIDLAHLSPEIPDGATLPMLITVSPSPSAPSAPGEHTPVPVELLEAMFAGAMAGM